MAYSRWCMSGGSSTRSAEVRSYSTLWPTRDQETGLRFSKAVGSYWQVLSKGSELSDLRLKKTASAVLRTNFS